MGNGKETEAKIIPKGLHANEHEVGGIDEIDVTDLAGVLAQPQPSIAHSHLTIPAGTGVEVYNANAPTNFTDLDLSGTIGAQATLVMLKVFLNYATASAKMAFRKNGDTDNIINEAHVSGTGDNRQKFMTVIVPTDNAGIIEWKGAAAQPTIIDVIAYVE